MRESRSLNRRSPLRAGLLLGAFACAAVAQPGARIVDFIADLRDAGVTIIYSDDVLRTSMRAPDAGSSEEPLDRLREMLAAHGLALEAGPRDTWLVVRGESGSAQPVQPRPSTPAVVIEPLPLESVVVSASRYAAYRDAGASARVVSRDQLVSSPSLGQDALRTTHDLPGVTSSGLTARMHVRGGELDEVQLSLDGVRLFDPFHLKDFQNLFSSINPRMLESMVVRTGGYPAEFGDRMSGVVEMSSITPAERRRHEIAVSTLSASILSSGVFAEGRGEWVTSLRRGNLDLLVDAADSDIGQPQYVDFFNKLGYSLTPHLRVSTGAFVLDDKISLIDEDTAAAGADYDDRYLWLRFEHEPGNGFQAEYLVTRARLTSSRNGTIEDEDTSLGRLSDVRSYDDDRLEADWAYELSSRHRLSWGVELARSRAGYVFEASRVLPWPIEADDLDGFAAPPADTNVALDGEHGAAYLSYRARAFETVTTELGLRWDRQTATGQSQLSPRLSVLFDSGPRTSWRVSWGRFHQSQRLDELQIADGLVRLFPAQRAEHVVLGFERLIGESASIRLEAYRKEFDRSSPRFENLFAKVSLLPELLPDRVMIDPASAQASGLELSLEGGRGRLTWWANLSRSAIEDELASGSARRSWDEEWAVKGGVEWSGPLWTVTSSAMLRSGWPITSLGSDGGRLVAGPYNRERLPGFRTLDVRAGRRLELDRGTLEWFVEVNNLLDHRNPCCIDYEIDDDSSGPLELEVDYDDWLGIVPTVGIVWAF